VYLIELPTLHETISGAMSYVRDPVTTAELLKRSDVDAIEIHTTGKLVSFYLEDLTFN
jgi:hypothetical protein